MRRGFRIGPTRAPDGDPKSNERPDMSIVAILVIIILVLLAIYLFQRVR